MRVIVTRPQAQAEPLLNALRAQGFEPIACPVIATEPIDDGPIDVTGYEWVIVTSANGAAELGARHTGVLPRVAAVGELTAAALEAQGIAVEFVPTLASQEGLLAELPRPVGRALFVGAEGARRLLADELPADFRAVYRTVELTPAPPDGDLVLLASPSAAAAWAKLGSTPARDHDRAADDGRRARRRSHRCGGGGHAERRRPRRLSRGVARFITFLTDFGLQDDFVGTCHGVMKRIAPEVEIIDITHGIPPQGVLQGALTLANTLPFMPEGVHLAVVDPGVGSARRPLVLRDANGRVYVGPDNGLLIPAAEKLGGITEAHELANPDYALESVSRTFHGRDLFAPAAAHLALGVPLGELGPPVDPDALARLDIPQPDVGTTRIHSTVLSIDRFGNIGLNLDRTHLEEAGVVPGTRVELQTGPERYYAVAARTFADARPGDIILYEDAYRNISIAINGGNAAEMFGIREGQDIRIHLDAF